jgi:hypothetical protein
LSSSVSSSMICGRSDTERAKDHAGRLASRYFKFHATGDGAL